MISAADGDAMPITAKASTQNVRNRNWLTAVGDQIRTARITEGPTFLSFF
jgi:lipopolysaccharide/colanic/teichoic acid biosynthesis glycosyltransferase